MGLPFSEEQFLWVFAEYNRAVWPAQLLLYSAAALALFVVLKKTRHRGTVVLLLMALLWLWMGAVYHVTFFTAINKAAYLFGALFILQGLLFIAAGVREPPLTFRFRADSCGFVGAALFVYSLVVYPVLGYALGHEYPAAPTVGLPCPTTIYTFGMLLWAEGRVPARLLIIPLAWSLLGISAAVALGMAEDYGLTAAAAAGSILIAARNRRLRVGGKVPEAAA
jgi:hypothetical protein